MSDRTPASELIARLRKTAQLPFDCLLPRSLLLTAAEAIEIIEKARAIAVEVASDQRKLIKKMMAIAKRNEAICDEQVETIRAQCNIINDLQKTIACDSLIIAGMRHKARKKNDR